jgi:hypothetical protein
MMRKARERKTIYIRKINVEEEEEQIVMPSIRIAYTHTRTIIKSRKQKNSVSVLVH